MFNTKAVREQRKARIAIIGPAGSGKTMSGLIILHWLGCKNPGVFDTESSSASTYAPSPGFEANPTHPESPTFDFVYGTPEGGDCSPAAYIRAMNIAEEHGVDGLMLDTFSHAWMGEGGILSMADAKGGRFEAWKDITPVQQGLMRRVLAYRGHIICTMRTKTAYEVTKDDRGKSIPTKIGLKPEQKEGMEYEFDIVIELDEDNIARVTKTRCPAIRNWRGRVNDKLGRMIHEWCESGKPEEVPVVLTPDEERLARARKLVADWLVTLDKRAKALGGTAPDQLAYELPGLVPVKADDLSGAECKALIGTRDAAGSLAKLRDRLRVDWTVPVAEAEAVVEPDPREAVVALRWARIDTLCKAIENDFFGTEIDRDAREGRDEAMGPFYGVQVPEADTNIDDLAEVERKLEALHVKLTDAYAALPDGEKDPNDGYVAEDPAVNP